MYFASETPKLFGVQVAVLALVIAAFGFVVSLIALGWQISKHILDGGRVKVYLNPAILEPNFRLITNRNGKWPISTKDLDHVKPENLEVAQLVVENPGRTAVTVYTPSLAVYGVRNQEYTIAPRMFNLEKFGSDSASTENVVRINPYDRATFLLDYWSIVPRVLSEAGSSGIRLRGNVSVAGRRRSRKSKRRLQWRIPQGSWTSVEGLDYLSPFTVMWRELYKLTSRPESEVGEGTGGHSLMHGGILIHTVLAFQERPSLDDFTEQFRRSAQEFEVSSAGFAFYASRMYEALDRYSGHLEPWSNFPGNSSRGE
ncbi:hypothetical protein ABZ901_11955 [Actinacidiphila alni]|uniref:hypothetical protein n=1 Tax=Actinacidiphila alni TaxID=380248 RepID=UPI00340389B8